MTDMAPQKPLRRAESQRQEYLASQHADREYGLAMLNLSGEEAREASSYERRSNGYRPDETDELWTHNWERDFEQSEWDNDPTMRGRW